MVVKKADRAIWLSRVEHAIGAIQPMHDYHDAMRLLGLREMERALQADTDEDIVLSCMQVSLLILVSGRRVVS